MLRKPLTAKCCDVVKKGTFYFLFYKDLRRKKNILPNVDVRYEVINYL